MKKVLFLTLIFLHCKEYLPPSAGRARDVVVVTPYVDALSPEISIMLETIHYTPQPEKKYKVKYMSPSHFDIAVKYHTLLLCLTPKSEIYEKYFSSMPLKDSFTLYRMEDVFADKQLVLLLIGKDPSSLQKGLKTYREKIRKFIDEELLQRLWDYTYLGGVNEKAQRKLEEYGIKLMVPSGFTLIEKYASYNFLYLVAHNPDRNIFIHWNNPIAKLSPEIILNLRDSLTALYYDNDYIEKKLTTVKPWVFKQFKGFRVEGVWQNEKYTIGGPFISFAFNTPHRFYFIDALLFSPEKKKLSSLNQLEVILNTFEP